MRCRRTDRVRDRHRPAREGRAVLDAGGRLQPGRGRGTLRHRSGHGDLGARAGDRPARRGRRRAAGLRWAPPRDSGGTAVTGYGIRYRLSGGSWRPWPHTGTEASAVVTGLTNGLTYELSVRAANGVDEGPWSSASAVPSLAALQPTGAAATAAAGGRGLRVSWTPPAKSGLERYEVSWQPEPGQLHTAAPSKSTWRRRRGRWCCPVSSPGWSTGCAWRRTSTTARPVRRRTWWLVPDRRRRGWRPPPASISASTPPTAPLPGVAPQLRCRSSWSPPRRRRHRPRQRCCSASFSGSPRARPRTRIRSVSTPTRRPSTVSRWDRPTTCACGPGISTGPAPGASPSACSSRSRPTRRGSARPRPPTSRWR